MVIVGLSSGEPTPSWSHLMPIEEQGEVPYGSRERCHRGAGGSTIGEQGEVP